MNELEASKQSQEIQAYCPVTGVRVLEYGSKQFSISGFYVTWWHCPACNGWHVVSTKLNSDKENARIELLHPVASI
ncbi:MAG: hypothetical protein L6R45_06485 [Anaerolineae bacterium]|nr:hypothetical protein [Anaerolineae bacterium]